MKIHYVLLRLASDFSFNNVVNFHTLIIEMKKSLKNY